MDVFSWLSLSHFRPFLTLFRPQNRGLVFFYPPRPFFRQPSLTKKHPELDRSKNIYLLAVFGQVIWTPLRKIFLFVRQTWLPRWVWWKRLQLQPHHCCEVCIISIVLYFSKLGLLGKIFSRSFQAVPLPQWLGLKCGGELIHNLYKSD